MLLLDTNHALLGGTTVHCYSYTRYKILLAGSKQRRRAPGDLVEMAWQRSACGVWLASNSGLCGQVWLG